jgi:hypothetical protein
VTINDPRDIPNLIAWYSADYEATQYANGDIITTLHDLSGNGHNLSRQPAASQPHLRTTGGPGNGAYIDTLNPPGFSLPGGFAFPNSAVTALTAAERLVITRNRAGEERGFEVMGSGTQSFMTFTDNVVYDSFGTTVRKTVGSVATTPGNDTWFRYRSMSKAGGWTAWFNGTQKFTTASNTVAWAASPTIAVTTSRNLHGFSLYILYGRELTAGERTDLETWAAANMNGGLQFVAGPPDTPTSLAVDPDLLSADFSWVDGGGVAPTGYDVRLDGGTPVDVGLVTTYEFTGLTPNTAYTAEVRAYNLSGDSAWASIGFTTDALSAPTGLTILGQDEDTLTLGWDTHPDAEGFEVRIDGGTPEDVGLTTLHMWDGLDPLTMYDLEVRAYLASSYSSWSSLDGTTETPPGPEGEYVVTLKVGSHEWTISYDDVLDPDDPVQVLDQLKIGWELNESDPWPAQPRGATCEIGFYATNVDELDADLAVGTPMSAVLEDGDGNEFATFHGRVTEPRATPIKRRAGLRMLYGLRGDDYTADLYEEPVTITGWPAEDADARMDRIVDLAATVGITLEAPADTGTAAFEELSEGTYTIGSLVEDHLRQIVVEGPARYVVAPVIVDDLLDHFECVLMDTTADASALPGTFAIVGGLLTLVFPDTEATGVVDAGDVNLDTTWTRLKFRAINRVKVAGSTVTAEAARGGPPVRLDLTTTLTDQDTADLMAELYLPDTDEALGWVADEFLYYAHRHQEGLLPKWFPDHREDPPTTAAYVNPHLILRIPSNINLAGTKALAGQLSKASVELDSRKVLVRFALRRNLPLPTGEDAASWEWAQDTFPSVAWEDIDPGLSWFEARLGKAV